MSIYKLPINISKKRLNQLINKALRYEQAEQDGRLKILPVKEGTTVYRNKYAENGKVITVKCEFISWMADFWNKTVFLDEQQAKEALENESSIN